MISMKLTEKNIFLNECSTALSGIHDEISSLGTVPFSEFSSDNTALILVDIINGFLKEGPLSCTSVLSIIPPVKKLLSSCISAEIPVIAFADCHNKKSPEFSSFPVHCLENTTESEIVDELKEIGGYTMMKKNSTNGCLSKDFQEFLMTNPQINRFIIVGDCTDICVMQFAQTLKCIFNHQNKASELVIPLDCVDTYHADFHNSTLMNAVSLKLMKDSGIKLVTEITC